MIMAPELMEGDVGLFALPFQNKYGQLIEAVQPSTMADDEQLNARKQERIAGKTSSAIQTSEPI